MYSEHSGRETKRTIDSRMQVAGVHLEWFGDPSSQTEFIAKYFRDHVKSGPAIILGDFNLEPGGGNGQYSHTALSTAVSLLRTNHANCTPDCNKLRVVHSTRAQLFKERLATIYR